MRLEKPRIHPVRDEDLSAEQEEILTLLNPAMRNLNLFRTTLLYDDVIKSMLPWSNYISSERNDLKLRDRELAILRTSYVCKSGYEWTYHVYLGAKAGLTKDEIEALKNEVDSYGWSSSDKAIINVCDELNADNMVSDETWKSLEAHFTEKQKMDIVFTSAHYAMVSKFTNTFGIQIDEGWALDQDLLDVA